MERIERQLASARRMSEELGCISFAAPVVTVYNPLDYAWGAFEEYVLRFGGKPGRVLFLGMNPGPWGMAQTGIPFGETAIVRDWLEITTPIGKPPAEHEKYPVYGYDCLRSEVSGRRLWGLFREKYGSASAFFDQHFVINYCPLLFIASKLLKSGKASASNLTPDKLSRFERVAVHRICDENLRELVLTLEPSVVVGIGGFADIRAREALNGIDLRFGKILHPSPASPRSNSNWAGEAERQLIEMGIWREEHGA